MMVGELFGRETQSGQHYDVDIGYRAFDICVNGKYLDYDEFKTAFFIFIIYKFRGILIWGNGNFP